MWTEEKILINTFEQLDVKGREKLLRYAHRLVNIEHCKGRGLGIRLQCWYFRNERIIKIIFTLITYAIGFAFGTLFIAPKILG